MIIPPLRIAAMYRTYYLDRVVRDIRESFGSQSFSETGWEKKQSDLSA